MIPRGSVVAGSGHGEGGKDVLIPIVKLIQSTYEGLPYKNLGMEQILIQEQQKNQLNNPPFFLSSLKNGTVCVDL